MQDRLVALGLDPRARHVNKSLVNAAYKVRCIETHPDKFLPEEGDLRAVMFRQVKEARDYLMESTLLLD